MASAIGGPDTVPGGRSHRDRLQHRRTLNQADRLNRKNALFAGSDGGGTNWTIIASLIETAKLNSINSHAWLTDTLSKLVNRWPANRVDDLMPWNEAKPHYQAVNV